jgi:hypothetical protein
MEPRQSNQDSSLPSEHKTQKTPYVVAHAWNDVMQPSTPEVGRWKESKSDLNWKCQTKRFVYQPVLLQHIKDAKQCSWDACNFVNSISISATPQHHRIQTDFSSIFKVSVTGLDIWTGKNNSPGHVESFKVWWGEISRETALHHLEILRKP